MLNVLFITEKLVQSSTAEFVDSDTKLFGSIVLVRPLPDDATVATLKDFFPGAIEIAIPRHVFGARYVVCSSVPLVAFLSVFMSACLSV